MGCFNHKGNFSQLPIRYGDRAVAIIGITSLDSPNDVFAPGETFTPISVPIRGTYNDYGGLENINSTPGVEALEKFFEMDAESIISAAELAGCRCDEPDEKITEAIGKIMNICRRNDEQYNVRLSYIMEHEDIFDYLVSKANIAIADRKHWRIPHEYIKALGYKEINHGKFNSYDIITWTHDSLPELRENCYVWKTEDYNNYSKVVDNLRDLCKVIGCEVPPQFELPFYEDCFKWDMATIDGMKSSKYLNIIEKEGLSDNDIESLMRFLERGNSLYSFVHEPINYGMFSYREGINFPEIILATLTLGANNHLNPEYMDDVIAVVCLMDSMRELEMTWGVTNYYRQDIDYDPHITFLNKCLDVANAKKTEFNKE